MEKPDVENYNVVVIGDLVDAISQVHRENVNLSERIAEVEDQLLIALERLNEIDGRRSLCDY